LGTAAPDLTDKLIPSYTPSALASALWNHTPAMWRAMAQRDVGRPEVTGAEWEDVFAWLYSLQFSMQPAEVGRGKLAFENNQCSSCHALAAPSRGPGKPVSAWAPLEDPVVLVYRMWNHTSGFGTTSGMAAEFARRKTPWPTMTGRDFLDLTVYLQYVQKLLPDSHFSLPEAASGRLAFAENCRECHTGPMALESRSSGRTWMDLAAGMWNHAPRMAAMSKPLPALSEEDMRKILAFVWDAQYQGPRGNPAAGERLFEKAGCVNCHRSPGNGAPMKPPSPSREPFSAWSMVALGWGPPRAMHQAMVDRGIAWPHLTPADMNDLVEYLNSLPQPQ
jgi:mono/diheme cytochrome c family protein